MDTRIGMIYGGMEIEGLSPEEQEHYKEVDIRQLEARTRAHLLKFGWAKVDKHAPCPCGSGKKFKNCCMRG